MTSNGTMANSSKKRKASELDSDPATGTPKSKSKSRAPQKSTRYESKGGEDIPFTTECPYRPTPRSNEDVFVQKEVLAPGFEFDFGVRPGMLWKNMRSYRNVKLQDHTFSAGTVVYINKQNPPPKALRPGATDAEILKYDRTNFWVGRIADTRAESDKAVFLRVFWLYWPEELPMGRQPYHSERELILSNAMDIIDAQTISGAADLTAWDEKDLDLDLRTKDRFWRQTFDISKLGKDRRGGLGELRKHCRCQQPHNPDRTMFQCKRSDCLTWNHDECLIEDILDRTWLIYEKEGTLDLIENGNAKGGDHEGGASLRHKLMSPVRHLGKMMQSKVAPSMNTIIDQALPHQIDAGTNHSHVTPKKAKPRKSTTSGVPTAKPWDGKLSATVLNADETDEDSSVVIRVEEISKKKSKSEPRSWILSVNCLSCGKTMD